jgi:circadian clock protein KaiC
MESPELFQVSRISQVAMSHLADNILLLQYQRASGRVHRVLTVLKTRASWHQPTVRRYDIGSGGIELLDPA